jgi:hypothetical protein
MSPSNASESPNTRATSPPLFSLPEYEAAGWRFFNKALLALMRSKDAFFAQVAGPEVAELPMSRVAVGDLTIDSEPFDVQAEFALSMDDAIKGEYGSFYVALDEAAQSALASLIPQIFQQLSRVIDATGQTIDAAGERLTPEVFLDLLDVPQWSFNDDGTHNMQLVLPQSLAERVRVMMEEEWTSEHQAKLDALVERKRKEHLARRRNRRLS